MTEKSTEEKKPREMGPLADKTINGIVTLMKLIMASVVDEHGNQVYPYKWNNKFAEVPKPRKKDIKRPAISCEIMTGLAKIEDVFYRVLFILLAATGARIGEMLAIEIDKHISSDFRTISIEQKVYTGIIEPRLKTEASLREVDLHPIVSALLRWFVGDRTSGFLFPGRSGCTKPIGYTAAYKHICNELAALGYQNNHDHSSNAGAHIFRRFRITHLRNRTACPEGLRKYWVGHSDDEDRRENHDEMSDLYDTIDQDRPFRLQLAEACGLGFELLFDVTSAPTVWTRIDRSQRIHAQCNQ